MPELKLTINAGSAITGGQLSVNEKRFLMPVDIDPAILTASGKDYIKDYTNRLFRFRGKISSLKSPCSVGVRIIYMWEFLIIGQGNIVLELRKH